MNLEPRTAQLISLLHLCDSLFPIGGFAHSDGLESAVAAGQVRSAEDLGAWLDICLDESIRRCDGPAVARAWVAWHSADWPTLLDLDAEVMAIRPASSARLASRSMGQRLLRTWHALYPDQLLAEALKHVEAGRLSPALQVAFAGACATRGVDRRETVEAYAYTRLAATVSASMRLLSIGQNEAHTRLASALARIAETTDGMLAGSMTIESFVPALDVVMLRHPFLPSRLFRS